MQAHLGALLPILAEAVIQCNPSDCISSTDLHNRAWGIKLFAMARSKPWHAVPESSLPGAIRMATVC